MTLKVYRNELDASDYLEFDCDCLLTVWLSIRHDYPSARLYKDAICVQNDITPKTKADAWALKEVSGEYQILCHAADPVTLGFIAAVIAIGSAVYTYLNMPDMSTPSDTSGSPNNSLAQRQNKHRVGERSPDIYGKVKSIPDLAASIYRYYKDNIQVEECLLCFGTGWFEIDEDDIKEGDTPINTIEGASISIYEPGQSIVSESPQIQIGAAFDELPLVTKQVSAIDGKQTLKSPGEGYRVYRNVKFTAPNKISIPGADFNDAFETGERISIKNAVFGTAEDRNISGNTNVSIDDGILTIASNIDIPKPNDYKKVRILSLLVDGDNAESLNLAGEYPVDSITKSGSDGSFVYEIQLSTGYKDINPSFYLITMNTVGVTSGVLTANNNNIDLSGEYTIASLVYEEMSLVNPVSINEDWNRIGEITAQQLSNFASQQVSFVSSKNNFIGWHYAGNKDTTGFIINFLAQNGIYQDELDKQVNIEVEYQMVKRGVPSGEVYTNSEVMKGIGNNRNSIGKTINQVLPTAGDFRFRIRRTNDNRDYEGKDGSLIDDVIVESAYSYYETKKSVYEYDSMARLRRLAIGSGTNASELNAIVHRKLETPNGFMATSNFADISIAMALDDFIGRMDPSEVDAQSFYDLSDEIAAYFGTPKACEFNYTFDDKYSSYQEMIFAVAEAVFCTARREGGLHYFNFERETPNSLALFNHRNIAPESMTVTEMFGIQDNYDGLEFKWRDPDDNYSESIIKLPDDLRTNYKTIDSKGVTNSTQAHFLANRAWNKLRYNRKAIEATVYGEGELVTRMDRIAVVDSTVPILCSGQVEVQENTILTLDYPVQLDETKSYVIHLQLKNCTVDVIDIIGQSTDYQIELARIPMMPLVTAGVTHAVFDITEATDIETDAYLITEKSGKGLFESTINAMSYDRRYYQNDSDFINNLIT
nr:host specificity factor TipJ family phage tail protein [uncultured Psychrobacter sp.]